MIEKLSGLPPQVTGFRATGKVVKEDYDKVIFPAIKDQVRQAKDLNYVFWVDTPLDQFSTGAWISDAWLGLKELAKWRRVAIVSDDEKIRNFTDKAGHFVPGEYRGFMAGQLQEAVQWAGAPGK